MTEPATLPARSEDNSVAPEMGERVYFPELDGLRFIAFIMVYLFHQGVPSYLLVSLIGSTVGQLIAFMMVYLFPKSMMVYLFPQGVTTDLLARLIGRKAGHALIQNGGYGVQLFFILSGYLITALLLREEVRYGRIALRAFWIRRILRIWPLYYLIIVLGFGLLPAIERQVGTSDYGQVLRIHLLPFLGFLGNWSMALVRPIPYDWLSVLWSVCVEEQFYLLVPLLIAVVSPRYRRPLVVILITGSIGVRWFCATRYGSQLMIVFNTFAQFDTLLSGVLLALLLGWDRNRPRLTRWLRWLQWPLYMVIVWGMTQFQLGQGTTWHRTWDFVWVWLCGVGIVVVAIWGHGWLQSALSFSRLVWLGKISYGLYMYHEIAIWVRERIFSRLPWIPNQDELFAIATLALTIALAAGSYYGYERRFLLLKRVWTRVPSRPV